MSATSMKPSPKLSAHDLHPEQQAAITRLFEHDSTLLVAGLGFGKAIVGLTAIQELLVCGELSRVLVLAPLKVAELTWGPEADKWSHITEHVGVACGTEKQRHAVMQSDARIVVTNLDNAAWAIKHYGGTFDGVLIDEMSKLKTSGGATVKALRSWVKKLRWRAGMSATPVAECAEDMYSQALLLDLGAALGTRKEAFMQQYFYPTDFMRYNWAPKPGAVAQMCKALSALVYMADDAQYKAGLPGVDTRVVLVQMSDAAREVYAAMEADSVWGDVIADNAAVRQGKLQQIAAGGLYGGDDREVVWGSDHKLKAVTELADTVDSPVIIVYNYRFELSSLTDLYPDAPVIGGGAKVGTDTIAAFNRGEIPVLLMHWRSGSHGLNLHGACHTMIHLSPVWSADGWSQSIGRIHRRGQTTRCTRYVLATQDTVESVMLSRVAGKAVDEKEFMDALAVC